MKQTTNYGLTQWEKPDRIMMEDFSGNDDKIDAALATITATAVVKLELIPVLARQESLTKPLSFSLSVPFWSWFQGLIP